MSDISTIPLTLRPLDVHDLPQVAQMLQQTQRMRRNVRDLQNILQPEETLGWVVETSHRLVGFVLCTVAMPHEHTTLGIPPTLAQFFRELFGKRKRRTLHAKVDDLCVATGWPQRTVERVLLEQLESELRHLGDQIQIVVPESNLQVQMFLHQKGYHAIKVLRGYYGSEDGYLLVWPKPNPPVHAEQRTSRSMDRGMPGKVEPHLHAGREHGRAG